jgi:hypothetical protein
MRIVIVGKRGAKRQVRWLAFLTLAITLWLLAGLGSGGVYFLLCGRWSYFAVLYGGFMGIGVVVLGLYCGLTSPLEKLDELPSKKEIK